VKRYLSSPILHELRPFLPAYSALFAFSFCSPILFLAGPLFARHVMDRVLLSRNMYTLSVLAVIGFFLILAMVIIDLIRKKTLERIAIGFDQRVGPVLFDALHRTRPSARGPGASASLADFNGVREFLSSHSLAAVMDAVWSPIFFFIMLMVHGVYGAILLVMLVLSVCLTLLNQFLVKNDNRRFQQASIKANEFGIAVSRNAETVRALGMLPYLRDRWYALHSNMLGWQASAAGRTDVIATIVRYIHATQIIMLYAVGAVLYLNGEISMSAIIMAGIIVVRVLGPITHVITTWRIYTNFSGALARLDDLLLDSENKQNVVPLPPPSGAVAVSRVFCAAPGTDKLLLNDVSFTLGQGRTLGVVGPSGAGKSVLARLLVGIWLPLRGSIAIGDHELSQWDQDQLGGHLGYVAQDIELLPGTLAENISRFDPNVTQDSAGLLAAADLAGIQDLVRTLPRGYNTQVGPGGHVLSGGQRNRVALARAVYGEPSFVVLDEPNSNLDAVGEQSLAIMLQKLKAQETTVVLVTHKLNLLNYCDDVLVLNAGTVQAFGSRDQIMSRIPRLKAPPALTVIEGNLEGRRS